MASIMQERQLAKLCSRPETITKARALLSLAQVKTGPGSGHELGPHTTALPAICAYIAAQQLNNNDVKRSAAQAAACLQPKDFSKALGIVETALEGSQARRKSRTRSSQTYENLLQEEGIPASRAIVSLMANAEETLYRDFVPTIKGDPSNDKACIKLAVYYWTCRTLKIKGFMTPEEFQSRYEMSEDLYKRLISALQHYCKHLGAPLRNAFEEAKHLPVSPTKGPSAIHMAATATPPAARSPTKSPTKSKLRELPTRDSPKKKAADSAVILDEAMVERHEPREETQPPRGSPAKRRKTDSASTTSVRPPPRSTSSVIASSKLPSSHPSASSSSPAKQADKRHLASDKTPSRPIRNRSVTPSETPESSLRRRGTNQVADAMDVDEGLAAESGAEEDEVEDELVEKTPAVQILTTRRLRPVFLDHKQWYRRDPRLGRVWKEAVVHREEMVKLYGHPFEKFRPTMDALQA